MKNDSLKTLLIASVGLILICLFWFLFLYKPELSKTKDLKQKTQQMVAKVQSFTVSEPEIKRLEESVVTLQEALERKQRKIIPKNQLHNAVQRLQKFGSKYHLKFDKIIPDFESLISVNEDGIADEVLALTMHVKLQSSYQNFGLFLENLKDLPFLTSVGELTMAYNERIFPELEVRFDMRLFVRETPQKPEDKTAGTENG